jgi:hypothetical protein
MRDAVIREKVLTLPGSVAPELATPEHPAAEIEAKLRSSCYELLEQTLGRYCLP